MQGFSTCSKAQLIEDILTTIRRKAERKKVKDQSAIVSIGLVPVNEGAEEWLDGKNENGLMLSANPLIRGGYINLKMVERIGEISKLMLTSKIQKISRGKNGVAIFYDIREFDIEAGIISDPAMEIYVYVGGIGISIEKAEQIALSAVKPIKEWSSLNNLIVLEQIYNK